MKTSAPRTLRPAVRVGALRRRKQLLFVVATSSLACSLVLLLTSFQFALRSQAQVPASAIEVTLPAQTIVASHSAVVPVLVEIAAPAEVQVAHDPAEAALALFGLTPQVKKCAKSAKVSDKTARIRVRVATDGRLESAVTASGNTDFQHCVLAAARELQFPALSEAADLSYRFRL